MLSPFFSRSSAVVSVSSSSTGKKSSGALSSISLAAPYTKGYPTNSSYLPVSFSMSSVSRCSARRSEVSFSSPAVIACLSSRAFFRSARCRSSLVSCIAASSACMFLDFSSSPNSLPRLCMSGASSVKDSRPPDHRNFSNSACRGRSFSSTLPRSYPVFLLNDRVNTLRFLPLISMSLSL